MRHQSRMVVLDQATVAAFGRRHKAARLAVAEQATKLEHLSVGQRAVYLVQGDHGTYRVTLYRYAEPWTAECSCPARALCSHMLAARAAELGALDSASEQVIA